MFRHIFGPVPSRRLGFSLGIDLVPFKTCSLNCVYCECGATNKLTVERKEYINYEEVIEEIDIYLTYNNAPDYITFSGSGEPTLNSRIGNIIDYIKNNYSEIPLAVLTNGTLLHLKEVRKALLNADLVIPSLDAASEITLKKINRPHNSIKLYNFLAGLIDFRNEFNGQIWLEVFILPDYNDNIEELMLIKESILKIKPDKIQINSLDRPGAVPNLLKPSFEQLENIKKLFGLSNVEIISNYKKKTINSFRKNI